MKVGLKYGANKSMFQLLCVLFVRSKHSQCERYNVITCQGRSRDLYSEKHDVFETISSQGELWFGLEGDEI